jgi:REP element-mobilizing transposase RayT
VHVTIKVAKDLPNLRRRDLRAVCFAVLEEAAERHGMRIVHFSIQSNHVHLIVECKGTTALQRGMKGLLVRLAKRLNKHLSRRGQVFPDRYHVEPLKTPTQVRHALRYVLNNARKHAGARKRIDAHWVDPCSTAHTFDGWKSTPKCPANCDRAPSMPRAGTWLLRVGWRKRGRIPIDDIPGPRR